MSDSDKDVRERAIFTSIVCILIVVLVNIKGCEDGEKSNKMDMELNNVSNSIRDDTPRHDSIR